MYDAKMHALSLMVCVVGDLHTITTTAINEPTRNRIRSTFTHTHTHYTQKHVYMNVFIVYQLQTLHTHTHIYNNIFRGFCSRRGDMTIGRRNTPAPRATVWNFQNEVDCASLADIVVVQYQYVLIYYTGWAIKHKT